VPRPSLTTITVTTITLLAALVALGCTEGQDVARLGADAAGDTDAGVDVHVPQKCPGGMIDVGPLCIDATEVTRGAYAAFLAGPRPTPRAECTWNSDFGPALEPGTGINCDADNVDLTTHPDLPVVCIDWCDADAFCRSAGKQLCGAIGGGPDAYDDLPKENDPTRSQWYLACAGEEKRAYPYGDTYVRGACRDLSISFGDGGTRTAPVGSTIGCHGPVGTPNAAVFDLSGNVAEWVDACQPGTDSAELKSCMARGGYFVNDDAPDAGDAGRLLGCEIPNANWIKQPRSHADDHIGFRCCFTPP
jgi:formylglycine-generating enzyme required for sulfatase activity